MEALDARGALLEGFREVDDAAHGGHHSGDIHYIDDHVPGENFPGHHASAAGDDDDEVHKPVEVARHGVKARHGLVVFPLGFQEALVFVFEAFLLHVFVGEGFRHPYAGDGVFDGGI